MRVVQAYAIQMLTDAYGPVAYSSVIEDPTGGASFSYDTQESVYNALFTLVDPIEHNIFATLSFPEQLFPINTITRNPPYLL